MGIRTQNSALGMQCPELAKIHWSSWRIWRYK